MKEKIALLAVAGSLFIGAFSGCGILEPKLEYALSEDGTYYSVVNCDSMFKKNVIIPASYNNLPVKKIGEAAFSWCDMLTGVSIPDSVTSIEKSAFV